MKSARRTGTDPAESDAQPGTGRRIAELEARVRELEAAKARLEAECAASRSAQVRSDADRAEKEWLAALLDSMNEEVYFTDTARHYTYLNPAALRAFGYDTVQHVPLTEVVGKLEVFRVDGTPRPIEEAPPLRALAGEIVRDQEQIVRMPVTGELRHRQVSSAPVRNAAGEIIGSVSVVRDVTDLRRINAALQSADRRKDEFIAMLAHELRNPLVPIRAGVAMLKNAAARPELLEQIRPVMERQLGHMVRLIDDLLDVSRITSGKIELRRQPVTVASVVATAVEANRAAIAEGGFDLSVDLAEPHRVLDVDPTRFTQVISNIVHNATKFTPVGGCIAITAHVEAGDRRRLALTVADNGIGISPDALPRVFELFTQERWASHADRPGLGIGLALARRLVEMHGGTIHAESEGKGRGSRFTIRLPIAADARLPEPVAPEPGGRLDGLRVVVVDDNHDAADATRMLVESLGAEARAAYDGRAGLASVEAFRPDVVLLDIGMPQMDGFEVCRRIRSQHGERIRVIALSGWGQEKDKELARQAGFDLHVTKPADPGQLKEALLALSRRGKP